MKNPYEDIINLPRPEPMNHPRMSRYDRAAQFSPFAALTGYGDAVKETERYTERKIELSEDEKLALDSKLHLAMERGVEVVITYFLPDSKKTGGRYASVTGIVKCVDELSRTLVLTNGMKIPIEEITEIESEIFESLF